jgi:hypothetical protein
MAETTKMHTNSINRRGFLGTAVAAGALGALPASAQPASPKGSFHLGSVTYNLLKDYDLETIIKTLEAVEFEAVELRTSHKHGVEPSISAAERTRVRRRFESSKVRLLSYGTTCRFQSSDPAERKQQLEIGKQFVDLAHDTGALGIKLQPMGLPPDVPQQTRVTVEAAARLQGELIALRGQLEAAKQLYTAENSRVKSIQAHVNELERELGKINSGKSTTGPGQDQSSPYPSVRNLPLLGVRWADLYRNTKMHETVVELLTQQYELARIQEAKEIPTVKVLDPASTPEKRYPKPLIIVVVGAILSVMLACFGVWLHDRWETWNEEDPRRILLVQIFRGSRRGISSITGMFGRRRADSPDHRMS